MIKYESLIQHELQFDLKEFKPVMINKALLKELGVNYSIPDWIERELIIGSKWSKSLFENKTLTPSKNYAQTTIDVNEELEFHNYTGICPLNVLEVSPSEGSCAAGCQYCLVTDGKHIKKTCIFSNYPEKLANSLIRNKDKNVYYYFSPKTEAFSEPFLFSGLAHQILRTFILHFNQYPKSRIRIFIATKAGIPHLKVKNQGESIFDLISMIPSKIQVNGSIGIMPDYLRNTLEPNAANINDRLNVLIKLQEVGVCAESVLCQPLFLPYITEYSIKEYLALLASSGIRNIKPEFFTANIHNIVLIAQYINQYNPEKLGEFFYPYLKENNQNHIKQRSRIAPDRKMCVEKLEMIYDLAKTYGISISICNWVKKELTNISGWISTIDSESIKNGYRCLGYQTDLFNNYNNKQ